MEYFDFDEVEVIGFLGTVSENPHTYPPMLIVNKRNLILFPSFKIKGKKLSPEYSLEEEEFEALCKEDSDYKLTKIEPRRNFDPNSTVYVESSLVEENGIIDYITHTEAVRRLISFSDRFRSEGDRLYYERNLEMALKAYERCSSVSQNPEDYARMILTAREFNGSERKWAIDAITRQLEKEKSELTADNLIAKVKEELEAR